MCVESDRERIGSPAEPSSSRVVREKEPVPFPDDLREESNEELMLLL